jgi:hypothetical protein
MGHYHAGRRREAARVVPRQPEEEARQVQAGSRGGEGLAMVGVDPA